MILAVVFVLVSATGAAGDGRGGGQAGEQATTEQECSRRFPGKDPASLAGRAKCVLGQREIAKAERTARDLSYTEICNGMVTQCELHVGDREVAFKACMEHFDKGAPGVWACSVDESEVGNLDDLKLVLVGIGIVFVAAFLAPILGWHVTNCFTVALVAILWYAYAHKKPQ